jgi:hypothetical protein
MISNKQYAEYIVCRQVRDAIAARIDVFLACENEGTIA